MVDNCSSVIQSGPIPPAPSPDGELPRATARELVDALADVGVDDLRDHHLALVLAVAEISQEAGAHWSWGPDDPTVALLRAAAKLALDSPEASSIHAARLRLALDERPR